MTADEDVIYEIFYTDLDSKFCEKIVKEAYRKSYFSEKDCNISKSIKSKIDLVKNSQYNSDTRLSIIIENKGSDLAQNVRFVPRYRGKLELTGPSGKQLISKIVEPDDSVQLPDINPSESYNVKLDAVGYDENSDDAKLPEVIYAKGKAENVKMRLVSPFLGEISDLFEDMPNFIIAIVIIFFSITLTLAVVFPIMILEVILKGKPISSAFQTEQQTSVKQL